MDSNTSTLKPCCSKNQQTQVPDGLETGRGGGVEERGVEVQQHLVARLMTHLRECPTDALTTALDLSLLCGRDALVKTIATELRHRSPRIRS
jgi:hypothetical protein